MKQLSYYIKFNSFFDSRKIINIRNLPKIKKGFFQSHISDNIKNLESNLNIGTKRRLITYTINSRGPIIGFILSYSIDKHHFLFYEHRLTKSGSKKILVSLVKLKSSGKEVLLSKKLNNDINFYEFNEIINNIKGNI